jgi:hypothetical protein
MVANALRPLQGGSDERKLTRSSIEYPGIFLQHVHELTKALAEDERGTNAADQGYTYEDAAILTENEGGATTAFRNKINATRIYGFVAIRRNRIFLTPLGRKAADPLAEREALVEAFMHVRLYRELFQRYEQRPLPSDAIIERDIVGLGVVGTQARRVRQVWHRSANYAGLFSEAWDRLTLPEGIVLNTTSVSADNVAGSSRPPQRAPAETAAPSERVSGTHPLITELVRTLPEPSAEWANAERQEWLETLRHIFNIVYKQPADDDVAF